jgi:glycosyltransferase involved in cell wall biosynthesis
MISFLICAFNEQEFIKATVDTINKSVSKLEFIDNFEIIIVNDGSEDLTEKYIEELKLEFKNITYCKNEKNLGYGASLKNGLKYIKYPKFMLLPGDNDISMESIVATLKHLHTADLVMPFPANTEDRTKIRNILSKIYTLIYIIFFDCCVNYINAPSIFPTKKVMGLKLPSNRNGIHAEMVTKLLHSDISFTEVPVFFGFQKKGRTTVTLSTLYDVTVTFVKLFIEIKIVNRNQFLNKAKRRKDQK